MYVYLAEIGNDESAQPVHAENFTHIVEDRSIYSVGLEIENTRNTWSRPVTSEIGVRHLTRIPYM